MAILLPQAEINFLTTSEFEGKLKALCRNTPSKPWIREYDDPVQLVWASPSELRSQHSQRKKTQVEQHSQQLQELSSSAQLETHHINKGKRGRSSKKTTARKGGKHASASKSSSSNNSRSSSSNNKGISISDGEHEVYVVSPSSINESNVFVNNVPVIMQTVENDHTNLSPTFLPSAITAGHELEYRTEKGSKTNKVEYSEDAQTIDKRVGDKIHNGERLFASKPSSFSSKQHKASEHSKSHERSQKKHKLEALQQVEQKQLSQELETEEHQERNVGEEMHSNIEFTPSSAEVREGSVEILSSPPPVMTIRHRPRKTDTKKASSLDNKTKTRQRRLQSNTDNDNNNNKVQLPMERFLRRS